MKYLMRTQHQVILALPDLASLKNADHKEIKPPQAYLKVKSLPNRVVLGELSLPCHLRVDLSSLQLP